MHDVTAVNNGEEDMLDLAFFTRVRIFRSLSSKGHSSTFYDLRHLFLLALEILIVWRSFERVRATLIARNTCICVIS